MDAAVRIPEAGVKPDHVTAIVVGVDHYRFDDADFRLTTPARDALRFVEWLIAQQVDMDQIALFLSAESWAEPAVQQWVATHHWNRVRLADDAVIANFINEELKDAELDTVVLFWGGHGFIDDNGKQCVFTANASEDTPYCIDIDYIVRSLGRHRLGRLREILCIVDACAQPYKDLDLRQAPVPVGLAVPTEVGFATLIGGYAAWPGRTVSGAFSRALLDELAERPKNVWPDFQTLLTDIATRIDGVGEYQERPRIVLHMPHGHSVTQSAADRPLLGALGAIRGTALADADVYRLYALSLPESAYTIGPASKPAALLHDLYELHPRAPGAPSPLAEFMLRLSRCTEHAPVTQWLREHVSTQERAQLESVLTKELSATAQECARLFIEFDRVAKTVCWFVQYPDLARSSPLCVLPWDPASGEGGRTEVLSAIVAEAAALPLAKSCAFAVGLLLDHTMLGTGVETTPVLVAGAMKLRRLPLNQVYPVLLHWSLRADGAGTYSGTPEMLGWKTVLHSLQAQLAQSGTTAIKWIPDAGSDDDAAAHARAAVAHLCNTHSTEVCIGLRHSGGACRTPMQEMIDACLEEGIPIFAWLADASADCADVERIVSKEFERHTPSQAPIAVARYIHHCAKAKTKASGQSLRVVWDDARMLPAQGNISLPKESS